MILNHTLCAYIEKQGNFDYFDITVEYNNNAEYHKIDMTLPYEFSIINDGTR